MENKGWQDPGEARRTIQQRKQRETKPSPTFATKIVHWTFMGHYSWWLPGGWPRGQKRWIRYLRICIRCWVWRQAISVMSFPICLVPFWKGPRSPWELLPVPRSSITVIVRPKPMTLTWGKCLSILAHLHVSGCLQWTEHRNAVKCAFPIPLVLNHLRFYFSYPFLPTSGRGLCLRLPSGHEAWER